MKGEISLCCNGGDEWRQTNINLRVWWIQFILIKNPSIIAWIMSSSASNMGFLDGFAPSRSFGRGCWGKYVPLYDLQREQGNGASIPIHPWWRECFLRSAPYTPLGCRSNSDAHDVACPWPSLWDSLPPTQQGLGCVCTWRIAFESRSASACWDACMDPIWNFKERDVSYNSHVGASKS